MTKQEREQLRHEQVIEKINNAKTIQELPKVSLNDIAVFLSNNIKINGDKIPANKYVPVINEIINKGGVTNESVFEELMSVIQKNKGEPCALYSYSFVDVWRIIIGKKVYTYTSDLKKIEKSLKDFLCSEKIKNILIEVREKNLKASKIIKEENRENHKQIMKQINSCFSIDELSKVKVGLGDLNRKILRAVNDNEFFTKLKREDIKDISEAYLNGADYSKIEKLVYELCDGFFEEEDNKLMALQILGSLVQDETIEYTAEEIKAKEERKLFIYKNDHEIMMDNIKEATRIGQLPSDLTISTLTSYLCNNSTIYPNDNRIKSKHMLEISKLLLEGYKFDTEYSLSPIGAKLYDICSNLYHGKPGSGFKLYEKLASLPRTQYLVDEINAFQEKYNFIIDNTKFNYYLVENPKAPTSGGQFFDVYIGDNQVEIPENTTDRDVRDWIVKEKHPGFRRIGGNILPRGIKISKIFTVGRYGISSEEKEILDASKDLEEIKKEKEKELKELYALREEKEKLLKELDELKTKLNEVKETINESINGFEARAMKLYTEMLDSAEMLKEPLPNKQLVKENENQTC